MCITVHCLNQFEQWSRYIISKGRETIGYTKRARRKRNDKAPLAN